MSDRPDEGIVPPNDLDAEAAVLSAILLSPDASAEVWGIVQPGDFFSDANRCIADALLQLYNEHKPIDVCTVTSRLTDMDKLSRAGGKVYLALIIDSVPAVANVAEYASRVFDRSRLRKMIATCQRQAATGYTYGGDAQEIIADTENQIAEISKSGGKDSLKPLKESVQEAYRQIESANRNGGGRTGAPSGFEKLDSMTGGWQSTDLIILAARPGMGKTAFAMGQALTVGRFEGKIFGGEQDIPTAAVVFSLEMPSHQLAMRMIAMEAHLDVGRIRQGKVRANEWRPMQEAAARLYKVRMHTDDTAGLSVQALRSRVVRLKTIMAAKGVRLGLVVVDYLQKLDARDPTAKTRAEQVGSIARGLKRLALETACPVMALSQLNRAGEAGTGRRPQLCDLRESGDIEQEADVVAFLWRKSYYERNTKTQDQDRIKQEATKPQECEVIIEKARNGPCGTVRLMFTPASTRFDTPADDWDEDRSDSSYN